MACGLIIGVDGGGSHTVAVAAQADGTVVALARGAGINYYKIGVQSARENLYRVVQELQLTCGSDYDMLCVGMSALDSEANVDVVREFAGCLFPADKIEMHSDAYTALLGLTLGHPGMIVICGTGSILMLLDTEGVYHVRGGWGHLLFDAGSAYAIALDGLRAAVDAWEGLAQHTALCDEVMRCFSLQTPRALIERLYAPGCTPDCIARFATNVLSLQKRGDVTAAAIVDRHMRHLARQTASLLAQHPRVRQVGLYGGIFLHNPMVRDDFTRLLHACVTDVSVQLPMYPPEIGALIHCFQKRGTLDEKLLSRLESSYRNLAPY